MYSGIWLQGSGRGTAGRGGFPSCRHPLQPLLLVNAKGSESPFPLPIGMGWKGLQTFLVRGMLLRQGGGMGQVAVGPSTQWDSAGGT